MVSTRVCVAIASAVLATAWLGLWRLQQDVADVHELLRQESPEVRAWQELYIIANKSQWQHEQECDPVPPDYPAMARPGGNLREEAVWRLFFGSAPGYSVSNVPEPSIPAVLGAGSSEQAPLRVLLWDDSSHNKLREQWLLVEGLTLHPRTEVVTSVAEADVVLWLTTMSAWEAEVIPAGCHQVVLIDCADGPQHHPRVEAVQDLLLYYKRSRVRKRDGVPVKFSDGNLVAQNTEQWGYSASRAMIRPAQTRDLTVVCALRVLGASNKARAKVVQTVTQLVSDLQVVHKIDGFLGEGGIGKLWMEPSYNQYFQTLLRAKIVVTCNPAEWEGDFRLWEALVSGALVFVDNATYMQQLPFPLVHKEHLIVYDLLDQQQLADDIKYYIRHDDEAARIAAAGQRHVLEHHMAVNRVDMLVHQLDQMAEA